MPQIAIASGKGGTGKTTVATSLARLYSAGRPVQYVDCDVEAPNGRFLLHPHIEGTREVMRPLPEVDASLCDACGKCSAICRFHAIAVAGQRVLVFPELCHGCGGCSLVCPRRAITEKNRRAGVITHGKAGNVVFREGTLDVGETSSVRLIRELRATVEDGLAILDCPPGASCPVVASVSGADLVVLVTEPTPFGLHDLRLAAEMTRTLGLRAGVVVNRDGIGDDRVDRYCREEGLPVFGRIPNDRLVAEAYARGDIPLEGGNGFQCAMAKVAAGVAAELGL